MNEFEVMLSEGKNELGRTEEVVALVLADKSKFDQLFQCYFSDDEWVRLRVSSSMKRVCQQKSEWLVPYLDRFLTEIAAIDQASTQWTLARLFLLLEGYMSSGQREAAVQILKRNLEQNDDWIVQNETIATLGMWAERDSRLRDWLLPRLEKFATSSRKSVAGRAKKLLVKSASL